MDLHPGPKKRRGGEAKRREVDRFQHTLQENEDWYQDLVEHSQDLLCIHDLQGRLLSVNPAPARVLGYSVEEMLEIPMREMVAPEYRSQFDAYLSQIATVGEAHGFMAVMTRWGERRIWEYHNTLRTEGVTSPIVRGIAHDITEQKSTEKRLREVSESLLDKVRENERTIRDLKLFRTLLDQSNDSIKVIDPETLRFLDANEKAWAELGYSREELLSMGVLDIDPAVTESSAPKIGEALRNLGSLVMEGLHRRKDGSTFPVEVGMKRVQLERDYIVSIARDLTERKQAEARLQASEGRYRALHDRAPVGICWVETPTGRFLGVNSRYCEITGRTEKDLLGLTFQAITHPDDLPENCEKLRQLAKGEVRHYEMEKRYLRPDGSVRWVEVAIVAMGPEGQIPTWHMAIVQDITGRREAEKRLREYERVVEALEERIVVLDRDYRYVMANRAAASYWGLKKEQLIGRKFEDQLVEDGASEEVIEVFRRKIDECFQGRVVQFETTYRSLKAGERYLHLSYFPIEGKTGVDRVAVIVQDITERKQAEEALRKSESHFRLLVEQASDGIFIAGAQGNYLDVNSAGAEMFGYSRAEILRLSLADMLAAEEIPRIEVERARFAHGEVTRTEWTFRRKDGSFFPGELVGRELPDGRLQGILRDITERRRAEEELRLAKEKLSEEKLYLEQAIDTELGFGEIIGRSNALKEVMEKVTRVAPSDATVLLLGETGTGKELVARALHRLSRRQNNSFIKLNCAAIPSGLLESELFGHEKGAFTGAVTRKIGRLELANEGTLFLDEVGEIPLSLQPKLLRVLQDQEFERLGGTQTLQVNFRLLAATNRNLLQSVKEGEFRSDLFYRLNVFPILIPPLRERREDVRVLVEHFARHYANRMNKSITSIPSKTMEALVRWEWPGNIRELENFVERSVILTPGSVLQAPLGELRSAGEESDPRTLRDRERERIIRALRECHGRLGGPNGAAARLGLERTTLQSKLSRLGIKPDAYRG